MELKIKCEIVSWDNVITLARDVALQIRTAVYKPDVVIAIARGGYVPARLICDYLDVFNLGSFRIAHYTGATKNESVRLSMPLTIDLSNMNVLLVDDVSDTGDTLQLANEYIRSLDPASIKIAVLHHKVQSKLFPDFYAQKVTEWCWLMYPWAIVEDVSGFIATLNAQSDPVEDIARQLLHYYNISASGQVISDALHVLHQRITFKPTLD